MNLGSISHRSAFNDCYALNNDEVVVNIKTGKDVEAVNLIYGDPYEKGAKGKSYWKDKSAPMKIAYELKYHNIWSITLKPKYKRVQYYFEIFSENEKLYYLENDFYSEDELNRAGIMYQYFKFSWLNTMDVIRIPEWAKDTVWYQIMPDRFCRSEESKSYKKFKEWKCENKMSYSDFYGGNLKGIQSKLKYLKDLGISGIYLTPVLDSASSHKYNINDYYKIDPDFGCEKDMINLIKKAHKLDIKVMTDAVFNHCGTNFFAWQDVLKNGENSPYFNWFFVSKTPVPKNINNTRNGEYFSFAFDKKMPKLNTNNEEVIKYLIDVLKHWVKDWKVDGIRFDVGDEISHGFIKKIRREIKNIKEDVFLLGEVWHDSMQYLQGDEYDSVMNYPFVDSINDFWNDENLKEKDLIYAVNRCYAMYSKEISKVLFNFLDSHDIGRAFTRCKENIDVLFQQLTLMMTLSGCPSIYYGTEIAMSGGRDPLNRKCMPWIDIEDGKFDEIINDLRKLLKVRKEYKSCRSLEIKWLDTSSRLIKYEKYLKEEDERIIVYLNAENSDIYLGEIENVLYSRKYDANVLKSGGVLIELLK